MSESDAAVFTSEDPTEIMATVPHHPKREKTLKTVQDKWPGHITIASDRASFSGCRMIEFDVHGATSGLEADDEAVFVGQLADYQKHQDGVAMAIDLVNLYFSTRANLLCLDWKPTMSGGIICVVTTQLDGEDLEELQEVQSRVNLEMREWREKRAKAREAEEAEAREQRRLAQVGKNAETYNLAGRIRELESEISELRKAATRAP